MVVKKEEQIMGLFGFGKEKAEKQEPTCCCSTDGAAKEPCCRQAGSEDGGIKVLGTGCKSCHEQFENAKAAVKAMGLNMEVGYVTDLEQVMAYGVMRMPAIVIHDKVVSMGKVLKAEEVEKLLRQWGY